MPKRDGDSGCISEELMLSRGSSGSWWSRIAIVHPEHAPHLHRMPRPRTNQSRRPDKIYAGYSRAHLHSLRLFLGSILSQPRPSLRLKVRTVAGAVIRNQDQPRTTPNQRQAHQTPTPAGFLMYAVTLLPSVQLR